MSTTSENNESAPQTNNYVTVIPIEYPRRGNYNPNSDYIVEQYSSHDDYIQAEDLSASQGTLYSVSQRIAQGNASYGSALCPAEQANYSLNSNWDRDRNIGPDNKDAASDGLSEKQTVDTNTTISAHSSVVGSTSTSSANVEAAPRAPSSIPTCVYLHNRTAILMDIEDVANATNDQLSQAIINSDEMGVNNKAIATQAFTLWMISPLLELQLKPTHKPYQIRQKWPGLLRQYSHASLNRQLRDEPLVSFQRNVFFPQHPEEKIKDYKVLELLYEEAKKNILEGKYPCETSHYIMLGGIQARIELGPYNPAIHTTHYFREEQCKFLPMHARKSSTWTWLPISSKNSAEVRLLEQYKRVPNSATIRKLMRKYLEFCWSLPFYGAAFFEGQIEQPVRGLMSLITHQDIPVLVAINAKAVYVIDDTQCTVLLGLRYEDLSWDYARPSKEDDPNCLPCVFLQFMVMENGARVSKILQIFSRQAKLMDTLISNFVHQLKRKSGADEADHRQLDQMHTESDTQSSLSTSNLTHNATNLPSLSNKLSKLTLATFDDEGRLIGQMGSWSFSY